MSAFSTAVTTVLTTLSKNPNLLKMCPVATLALLQKQGNPSSQGTGNKVTNQEASFADVLTCHGFTFLPKGAPPPSNGFYYIYQLKGSQKGGDFGLHEYHNGIVKSEVIIDLKHTTNKIIFLNDGWFQKDVVYVISWNSGTKKKPMYQTHIALGQDIPSDEEQEKMKAILAIKRELNMSTSNVGSLQVYIRFGNKYSCERFTTVTLATKHLAAACTYIQTLTRQPSSQQPPVASSVAAPPQQQKRRRVRIVGLVATASAPDTTSAQAQSHE
jgi:hypothetical protein